MVVIGSAVVLVARNMWIDCSDEVHAVFSFAADSGWSEALTRPRKNVTAVLGSLAYDLSVASNEKEQTRCEIFQEERMKRNDVCGEDG
ncbi:hypothetical protein FQA47_022053 [Oryzias melastigma]|uniref:Uncharacterized protein n=1 Tax=Oryzias melastigma TaxID=30732 RepID=A0A834FJG1_ORYME|nr:hypothetical protein FQA47_022053 [Oryzias melastigma]